MKRIINYIVPFLLLSNYLFSQTKINFSDLKMNIGIDDRNKVEEEIYILKKDNSKFAKGKYLAEAMDNGTETTVLFETDDSGLPIGAVEGKYHNYRYI